MKIKRWLSDNKELKKYNLKRARKNKVQRMEFLTKIVI